MQPDPSPPVESPAGAHQRVGAGQPAAQHVELSQVSGDLWDRLIEEVDAASILVVIQGWLGPSIERWHTAEDVWQETLLEAWRDREGFQWRGAGAFRSWLLTIAQHRIRDFVEQATALKRGGGRERRFADLAPVGATSSAGEVHYAGPVAETSPDRIAIDRERAEAMHGALVSLPDELVAVLRLRLFEDQPLERIATQLGIGVEAARYRFRKAATSYRDALRRAGVPTSRSDRAADAG